MGEHNHNSGMTTWRAGCSGSCTSGSVGGPGKPTSREADRAPRSDPYTYVPTGAGFLYLAVVIDLWSRKVVGWSMRSDLTTPLVTDALDMAIAQRNPEGVIHHSDRGSQGGFNWWSQHLVIKEVDGECCGSSGRDCGDAWSDVVAWSTVDSAA